jgi:rhodanese-related sulfurtransferase
MQYIRKLSYLLLVIMITMTLMPPVVIAQEAMTDIPDVVMTRIEEYGALIPELDHYNTVNVADFQVMLMEEDVVIVDVRENSEVEETGVIDGSIHIPLRTLADHLDLLPDQDALIVVVCKAGFRATIGMTALHVLGYENAHVLTSGFDAWLGEELPVVEVTEAEASDMPAIDEELVAYVSDFLMNLPEGWGAVKPDALFEEMFDSPPDYIIDVRSEAERSDPGSIEDSEWIWVNEFIAQIDKLPADKDANIVVYCGSGYRAGIVATIMGMMGYTNVRNMAGGINGWIAAELPLVSA